MPSSLSGDRERLFVLSTKGNIYWMTKWIFKAIQNKGSEHCVTKKKRWRFMVNLFNIWLWDLFSVKYLGVHISINQTKIYKVKSATRAHWYFWPKVQSRADHTSVLGEKLISCFPMLSLAPNITSPSPRCQELLLSAVPNMSHMEKQFINPKVVL